MNKYTFKTLFLIIPVVLNVLIFFLLALIHFYWAFGGKSWYEAVLPTSSNGLHRMNPSKLSAFIIAFGLLLFAIITIGNLGLFRRYINTFFFQVGSLIIAVVFFLRSMGDFKFFGFFKTIKATRFGVADTQFFTPLCLCICLLSLLIFRFRRDKNRTDRSSI